jgi:hypothetical protein
MDVGRLSEEETRFSRLDSRRNMNLKPGIFLGSFLAFLAFGLVAPPFIASPAELKPLLPTNMGTPHTRLLRA